MNMLQGQMGTIRMGYVIHYPEAQLVDRWKAHIDSTPLTEYSRKAYDTKRNTGEEDMHFNYL